MAKNIIICSDGTGNTAIKNRGTNVFKLFEAVDLNGHRTNPDLDAQVALYDDGVGTQTFLPLKLLGGAFGFGLARNVRNLYKELVRIYDPGDRIYLFGFSRGAFTARSLAGMIAKCGVLDREKLPTSVSLQDAVQKAYKTYRRSYRTRIQKVTHAVLRKFALRKSDTHALEDFRKRHSIDYDVRIRFIGVWDTVDAVGGPLHTSDIINAVFHRFKFPDHVLSGQVDHAYQAMAVDEARAAFQPVLWQADPRIEQVWFAGVHSNVGGGYAKQGMSLVTLEWILLAAHDLGLRILQSDREYYREHGNVDDKLYDSRAGLGVFYRWKPRDMRTLSEKQKSGWPPSIHLSVLERIAHGTDGYNPGTLAHTVGVTFTRSNHPDPIRAAEEDAAAAGRARAVEAALKDAFAKRGAELDNVKHTLIVGRLSYYIGVLSCIGLVLIMPGILYRAGRLIVQNLEAGQWNEMFPNAIRLLHAPWILATLLFALALSAGIGKYIDSVRNRAFSQFWHLSRQELRTALKDAKKQMQAAGGK